MGFCIKVGSRRTDAPAGKHHAVVVDFVDLGMSLNPYDKKGKELIHKVELRWECATMNPWTGQPFFASKAYKLSLDVAAALYKDVDGLEPGALQSGEEWTPARFNALVGRNCTLTIIESANGQFFNVSEVSPPDPAAPVLQPSANYRRQKWADSTTTTTTTDNNDLAVTKPDITDEDIPF